ncbi:MAG: TonB-dependent receptor [Reichenbachiella sp.]
MKRIILIVIGVLCSIYIALSQDMTQTIRGVVLDQDTQSPLIGATVQVVNSMPVQGSIVDVNGNFRIDNIPIGRVSLKINYVGYEDKVLPNLLVTSAKEVVIEASLIESFEKLEEVVINAKSNKAEVLNEMSIVSARSFTVEETKRYAGSFADPARMVSAFAGVTNQAEGNNDIIVRGNSPKGILWKLEGIEIPNPNHFANEGATGGPINALNSNMLSDSDFMSGAFAPEYGNALSGVFDMKLKKGNNQQREYTATASTLGLDFTLEGPFKEGYDGSYLANYRYSSLAIVDALGLVDFGGVPKYQDVSFNVNLPINKSHFISIFGLGGLSSIAGNETIGDDEVIVARDDFETSMGVTALSHTYLINKNSFLKTTLSVAGTTFQGKSDYPDENGSFYNVYNSNFEKSFFRGAMTYHLKINSKHKIESGFIYSKLGYSMVDNTWNFENDQLETVLDDAGSSSTFQAHSTWQFRMAERLTLTSGLHFMQFGLNNSYSIEPRAAFKWQQSNKQAFTLGLGVHSKVESMSIYLGKQQQVDGSLIMPNTNLGLSKALHYVFGYDRFFGPNNHLKMELYYQRLFDVPVEDISESTYSLLNQSDNYTNRSLVNEGFGTNYGLELTFERYLFKGFYMMSSASVYQSLYTPMDGVERESAFAGNYIFNLLGGKEWKIGKSEKNKVLFLNSKVTLIGGKKYTPIDLEASRALGSEVRIENEPYSVKGDDVFILNFSIGTRKNKKNTTREFKIDIQNATNHQAVINQYYVSATESIEESKQLQFFPTISYTFSF